MVPVCQVRFLVVGRVLSLKQQEYLFGLNDFVRYMRLLTVLLYCSKRGRLKRDFDTGGRGYGFVQ